MPEDLKPLIAVMPNVVYFDEEGPHIIKGELPAGLLTDAGQTEYPHHKDERDTGMADNFTPACGDPNCRKVFAEHKEMLDYLKAEYTREGETFVGDMIARIDPDWPNPWRSDPEPECICPVDGTVDPACPVCGPDNIDG